MPRFLSQNDEKFMRGITRELVDEVIETPVVIFKISVTDTKTNIYGEGTKKVFYTGVEVPCLIERQETESVSFGFGQDKTQTAKFKFQRSTLQEKQVYPEIGDYILFNESYYEIDNADEEQLIAGQPYFNHSIVCTTHLTRKTLLTIEERPV